MHSQSQSVSKRSPAAWYSFTVGDVSAEKSPPDTPESITNSLKTIFKLLKLSETANIASVIQLLDIQSMTLSSQQPPLFRRAIFLVSRHRYRMRLSI